jgi:hypothetical protein
MVLKLGKSVKREDPDQSRLLIEAARKLGANKDFFRG